MHWWVENLFSPRHWKGEKLNFNIHYLRKMFVGKNISHGTGAKLILNCEQNMLYIIYKGVPLLHYVLVNKCTFICHRWCFQSFNVNILFLHKFANFWYSMFCSQFDANLAQVPWAIYSFNSNKCVD